MGVYVNGLLLLASARIVLYRLSIADDPGRPSRPASAILQYHHSPVTWIYQITSRTMGSYDLPGTASPHETGSPRLLNECVAAEYAPVAVRLRPPS